MKKKNFLDKRPFKNPGMEYNVIKEQVTIYMPNRGFYNKLAQILFKTPKVSRISLEKYGSFIWQQIDGNRTVYEIGLALEERFGDVADPVYKRLIKYLCILKNNGFIKFSC